MFTLKDLPYDYASLEPYMDARTLQIHHGKHHQTYINNLNAIIQETHYTNSGDMIKIIIDNKDMKNDVQIKIFNNAAQSYNHEFYWNCMKPNGGGHPNENGSLFKLMKQMFANEQTNDDVMKKVNEGLFQASLTQFGSGWGWLVYNKNSNSLEIKKTSNAGTPITESHLVPLLTIDVWEHAYYLSYQNQRNKYLENFFGYLVNWNFAEENLQKALMTK